eukprot:GAHX01000267.1.p1 GENE.GAHX01000267.1~~GAHX01000267.1.p1  ORF type:complete len:212 (-),score=34.56 GAHX01000267.1:30-644(-)
MASFSNTLPIPDDVKTFYGMPMMKLRQTHYLSNSGLAIYSSKVKSGVTDHDPKVTDPAKMDIIDEAIKLFRANIFVQSFRVKNQADRLIAYLTCFINHLIKHIKNNMDSKLMVSKKDVKSVIQKLYGRTEAIPGENNFPLNSIFLSDDNISNSQKEELRTYFKVLKIETANRIIERMFEREDEIKHWLQFSFKDFMNINLMDVV